MYSRTFSDDHTDLPPHYAGTALHKDRHKKPPCPEDSKIPPPEEEYRKACHTPPRPPAEDCTEPPPPPPEHSGLLSRLLPFDIKGDDLLLLGIALLLLNEGCEDIMTLILGFLLLS